MTPYVYNFPMSKAIEEDRLMKYCYYPRLAYLNDEEMQDYTKITEQLLQLYDSTTKQFKDLQKAKKLLMIRKRILHKADDKMRVFKEIIKEIGQDKLKYCFVYVPEGKRCSILMMQYCIPIVKTIMKSTTMKKV